MRITSAVNTNILNQARLPARLDTQQAAELLGFMEHDIAILTRIKLLKPLGNPSPNGQKYFSATELEALAEDREWLSKASRAVTEHWRSKNLSRAKDRFTETDRRG